VREQHISLTFRTSLRTISATVEIDLAMMLLVSVQSKLSSIFQSIVESERQLKLNVLMASFITDLTEYLFFDCLIFS